MASFITTPGHGYLKATLRELRDALSRGYRPTEYSRMNATHAFLEEDVDAWNYVLSIGKDKDWYGSLKTEYRRRDMDWKYYVKVAQSIQELDHWIDVVNRRKDLKPGAKVTVFGRPFEVLERRSFGGRVEYLVLGDQVGWTSVTNIEDIIDG